MESIRSKLVHHVFRLFAAAPQSPSSNPTPPTRRRRAVPIEEVVRVVIKSARSPVNAGTFAPMLSH